MVPELANNIAVGIYFFAKKKPPRFSKAGRAAAWQTALKLSFEGHLCSRNISLHWT